eukprot:5051101-Amphidinium_carterae.1
MPALRILLDSSFRAACLDGVIAKVRWKFCPKEGYGSCCHKQSETLQSHFKKGQTPAESVNPGIPKNTPQTLRNKVNKEQN